MFFFIFPGYFNDDDLLALEDALMPLGSLCQQKVRAMITSEQCLRGGRPCYAENVVCEFPQVTAEAFEIAYQWLRTREPGRMAVPRNGHELWAQFKYSVMARDPAWQKSKGREIAVMGKREPIGNLAHALHAKVWEPASEGRAFNGLQHMWGHVNGDGANPALFFEEGALYNEIRRRARELPEPYLWNATALSDLGLL